MKIQRVRKVAKVNLDKLKSYQSGELKPIYSGFDFFDNATLPLLPGDIVCIAGNSGGGKSKMLQEMRNNIMSHKDADDYVWLDNSLEMKFLSTILRDLHDLLEIDKKTILTQEFDDRQKDIVNNYYKFIGDDRFYINEEVFTPSEFNTACTEFLEQHVDKKAVFITIDHMGLIKSDGEKKGAIDGVVEILNALKKQFPNVVFIILSQYNRGILGRTAEKTADCFPNRQDLYQSDTMYHICDFVIGLMIPFSMGITNYGKVSKVRYDYMHEHLNTDEEDLNGRVPFLTESRVFYHKIKDREGGLFYRDIFVRKIDGIDNAQNKIERKEGELDFRQDVIQPQESNINLFVDVENVEDDDLKF